MTIDFAQKFVDPMNESKPITDGGKEVTLRVVAYNMLIIPDAQATEVEKLDRYRIAFKIAATEGAIDLSLEDAALVKKLIGKHPFPLIVGQAYAMLEKE